MTRVFSSSDRNLLLAIKGVGPIVISRLETMGLNTLPLLAAADTQTILEIGASLTTSSCWKNSPLAKRAIQGAIDAAKASVSNAH